MPFVSATFSPQRRQLKGFLDCPSVPFTSASKVDNIRPVRVYVDDPGLAIAGLLGELTADFLEPRLFLVEPFAGFERPVIAARL